MTSSSTWEQWDGTGFPSEKPSPVIYYFPGRVDIEQDENLDALITEMHQDGVAETKNDARIMLNRATVVHGQVVGVDGDLQFYTGPSYGLGEEVFEDSHDATWVEMDELDD